MKEEIIEVVKKYLSKGDYKDIDATIIEDKIYYKDEWWHVPIKIACPPVKPVDYYTILANLEQIIDDEEKYNIMLETYWEEI